MEVPFIIGAAIGFLIGVLFATTRTGQIKEENDRLNRELRKLTDRESKGRFKGGK